MKIVLLYNLNRGNNDYEAEFDSDITIRALHKTLLKAGEVKCVEGDKSVHKWIQEITEYEPDIIFCVAEGYNGPGRESFYPALFDQLGYLYSCPDINNLYVFQNKYLTKKLVNSFDVKTPRGFLVASVSEVNKHLQILEFPVIVKPNFEGSSMGINNGSIVNNKKELTDYIHSYLIKSKKPVIVEEYIDGFDISMAFVEGIGPLGPAYIKGPNKIYDWNLKTVNDDKVEIVSHGILSTSVIKELKDTVDKIAKNFDIKGYAKIDFRIDCSGIIYLLEINGQISLHPRGEFVVSAESDGYTFDDIVLHILKYSYSNFLKIRTGYKY